jgi:hypothetical protein
MKCPPGGPLLSDWARRGNITSAQRSNEEIRDTSWFPTCLGHAVAEFLGANFPQGGISYNQISTAKFGPSLLKAK